MKDRTDKTSIPNAKPEVLKKRQQNLVIDIGQKSIPFPCHPELLRKYVIFLRSWEYREYSSLITLVSKHPILVIPKEEKINLVIPRQWHHSFSMKGEKSPALHC